MSTENDDKKKAAPAVRGPDEPIRMRELRFHHQGGVDLPNEQRVSRITTVERVDRPRYEIDYLPRVDKYRVKEYKPSQAAGKPSDVLVLTFLVPGDWCLGVLADGGS